MIILKRKVENMISAEGGDYVCDLRNININGRNLGCSGFITNPANGVVVYVDTQKSCYRPISDKNLVRYARDCKDYHGGVNEFISDYALARVLMSMLKDQKRYEREFPQEAL